MKKILLAIALTLGFGSVMASDLSSVGTKSTEATVGYSYMRDHGTPDFGSTHELTVGGQVNAGGLGSFVVSAGDTQVVTKPDKYSRLNLPTFTVGYANGVKIGDFLGGVGLVGEVDYSVLTGNKWIFGSNSMIPDHAVSGTAEVNLPVGFVVTHWLVNVRPYVDYTYTHEYNRYGNGNDAAVSAGIYAVPTSFDDHVVTKLGYQRSTQNGLSQGVVASLSYKF